MSELVGLVACGGQSSRMGKDKCLLDYHGMPQRDYIYELLQPFCHSVIISCNREQAGIFPAALPLLPDDEKYTGIGPMASLLSAFGKFPSASFLIAGCDYPFVTKDHLRQLTEARTEKKDAVCYRNPETSFDEPLLAVYENSARSFLMQNFRLKKYSLRHLLKELNTSVIIPDSVDFLKSIDDPEEFKIARKALQSPIN